MRLEEEAGGGGTRGMGGGGMGISIVIVIGQLPRICGIEQCIEIDELKMATSSR